MSATRIFMKLLISSGSGGGRSVTVGLPGVGLPPMLTMSQVFAILMYGGACCHHKDDRLQECANSPLLKQPVKVVARRAKTIVEFEEFIEWVPLWSTAHSHPACRSPTSVAG
jgi:hypothetical protein